MKAPVLVIGSGLVGRAAVAAIGARGGQVVVRSRSTGLSLEEAEGGANLLALVRSLRPRAVLLAHGPSSPEWCEEHAELALSIHRATALALVDAEVRVVLVSTANVFDGSKRVHTVSDAVTPCAAYGRAKLAAERGVGLIADRAIVRVSLVYGSSTTGGGFVARALRTLASGGIVEAPTDQIVDPLYADDVGEVLAEVALGEQSYIPRLVHLGGPTRLSRHALALLAAHALGASPVLVRPVKRSSSTWALRPKYACLKTSWLPERLVERGLIEPPSGLGRMAAALAAAVGPEP